MELMWGNVAWRQEVEEAWTSVAVGRRCETPLDARPDFGKKGRRWFDIVASSRRQS